jgi:hypothetical protein
MNINLIKTSTDTGAVFINYRTSNISPEYNITLPFRCNDNGVVDFKISEECLRDLVNLIQQHFGVEE